jgi:predicted ATPase/DNA-binding CsgD family transcriptional regulator
VVAAVPAVSSSFVGRAQERDELRRLLGQERLVTVVGPGGCGKTRLAVETVGDGVAALLGFAELAPVRGDLADRVLTACGYRDDPGRSPDERLRDLLGTRSGLLVLDNCEHVRAEAAALAADLLRSCPGLRVLATSRVGLGLPGETVLPLTGLRTDGEAVALLLDRARRVQPRLPGGWATEEAAREICLLLDGLPLAIELAAAHARSLALPAIRAALTDRPGFLVGRDPTALPQHRSLAASIAWSVDLVGPGERRAFAALSLLDGRFGLDAALAVTGGDRAALETLVDVSLVQHDPQDGSYLLLETVREHADGLLTGEERLAAGDRLLRWAVGLAAAARTGLEHGDVAVVRRVAADDAAIASALRVAVGTGRGLPSAAALVADLAFAWSLRGRCVLGRARAEDVCAALDPPPPLAWARAFLAAYSGDLVAGLELAEDAAGRAAAAGDDRTLGRALILTGMAVGFPDPAAGEPLLTEAVACAERAGDDWGTVEALQVLAYLHLFRSDHPAALRCADEALPGLARLDHPQLRAWDAAIRAHAAAAQGRYAEAAERGRVGRDLAMSVGEPVSAFGAVLPRLQALVATGRRAEATAELADFEPFSESHPGLGTDVALASATATVASLDRPADAAAAAERTVALAAAQLVPSYAACAGLLLGTARLRAGDPAGAVAAAAEAARWAEGLGDAGSRSAAALLATAARRALGDPAVEAAYDALATAAALGLAPVVADGLDVVAGLALDVRRPGPAARLQTAADRLRGELGAVPSPLADLLRQTDGPAVAAALGEVGLAAARRDGASLDAAAAIAYARRSRGPRRRPASGWDSLTPTEGDVVALVAQGLTNAAIGARLLMSAGTVRTHLRSVFAKLGVTSRAELAAAHTRRAG